MGNTALLKKPNKVLRDTFMLQGTVKGIDLRWLGKWLEGQNSAMRPDVHVWHKIFADNDTGLRRELEYFISERGYASAFAAMVIPLQGGLPFTGELSIAGFILRVMDRQHVKAYYVDSEHIAFVSSEEDEDEVKVLSERENEPYGAFYDPKPEYLFAAALENWEGWFEEHEDGPHPLCDILAKAQQALSQEAGELFDQAVAVSKDGRRVMDADEVVAYGPDPKSKVKLEFHLSSEFREHKIVLGSVSKVDLARSRKADGQSVYRTIKKFAIQPHFCRQALLRIGEKTFFLTPLDSIPPEEEKKPAEPLFPRREESGISDYESSLNPENAVLDGIAPSPFDDAAGGGIIGPTFEGEDGLDTSRTPRDLDCTDPAQKPPQRIEAIPSEPDATRAQDVADDPGADSPPNRFAYRVGRGIAYGAPFDDDACAPPDPIRKAPLEEPSDAAKKDEPKS